MTSLPLQSLLPETIHILNTLTYSYPSLSTDTPTTVTTEEFIQAYKNIKESTSSSPSGWHVGHYKAIVDNPNLVNLHSIMMTLPFQHGFVPKCWSKVTDIMLRKDTDHARCHRLCIIALFESNLNQAKRILIGRKLIHHLEDNNLNSPMQYGSHPAQQCQSAVLQKVLTHDISHMTKRPTAYIENDAIGCYDRIANNLALLLLQRLGFALSICQCLGSMWENTTNLIKTAYGTSTTTYKSTTDTPLFGPGQGSTTGPPFWLIIFFAIVDSLDLTLAKIKYTAVCKTVQSNSNGSAFVDDSSLEVTSTYKHTPALSVDENTAVECQQVIEALRKKAQHWERPLFSTGGAINTQKSHWYLLSWKWNRGKPVLSTIANTPASLSLTAGYQSSPLPVPSINPHDSFRTLGVHISPSGSQIQQFKNLRNYTDAYFSAMSTSSIAPDEAFWSYMAYLGPKLTYPLACSSLTDKQCKTIQAPALAALLPKLHLNHHTPHAVIFGAQEYGGLALPDLYTDQGYQQLKFLIGHLNLQDEIGKLILIAISFLQLITGALIPFFTADHTKYKKWIDKWWLTSIWGFTSRLQIGLDIKHQWHPQLSREQDATLMDFALQQKFPHQYLQAIKSCRLYLQVITISDISSADGKTLLPEVLRGEPPKHRTSQLLWPFEAYPAPADWKI
jgi:hypothetical protein